MILELRKQYHSPKQWPNSIDQFQSVKYILKIEAGWPSFVVRTFVVLYEMCLEILLPLLCVQFSVLSRSTEWEDLNLLKASEPSLNHLAPHLFLTFGMPLNDIFVLQITG